MLPDVVRKRIEAEAIKRGQDPAKAIAQAERLANGQSEESDEETPSTGSKSSRPTFERLLIGVLPFIKVRELRSIWLGLPDRIPDDELTCGEFQVKYGGASTPAEPEAE